MRKISLILLIILLLVFSALMISCEPKDTPISKGDEKIDLHVNIEDVSKDTYIETIAPEPEKTSGFELAQEIHYQAWEDVSNNALEQPQYKYGIYASRSMAVKYPEIYLQADRMFYEKLLRTEPGTKAFFENKTKDFYEREELINNVMEGKISTKSLLWSDIDVKDFVKMEYKEFYLELPFLDYLDIRMYGLANALQPTDMKMVPLNMAEIVYFQEKDLKKSNPYILMTEKGEAYIWSNDRLLECNGEEANEILGNPVLIFNENYTWYPLMERDDTGQDNILDNLVSTYTTKDTQIPKLSEKEEKLIESLRESTEIKDETEEIKIKYHSSRIYTGFLRRQDFKDRSKLAVYDKEKNYMRELDTGFVYYIVAKNSNYLSPVTAHYASKAKEFEDKSLFYIAKSVVNDFHEKTTTGHDGISTISSLSLWGNSELVYSNIDDTWLTKSSMCMYSASNAASIFELADIKDLEVIGVSLGYTDNGGGHMYLAIYKNHEKRLVENFGTHGENNNALINYGTSIFRGFVIEQDWVMFYDDFNPKSMKTYTNKDRDWVLDTLEYVKDRSDSKAVLVTTLDTKTGSIDGISIVDFISNFNSDNIYIYEY